MNTNQSSTQVAEAPNPKLKALAWGMIFIVSVPQIIYRLLVPSAQGEPYNPIWLVWAEVAIITMLWVMALVWPAVRPLRGFFLAILSLFVGLFLIIPLVDMTVFLSVWRQLPSWGLRLVTDRLKIHLVIVTLMALSLIGSGIGRRELFLVMGNPSAPCRPSRLLPSNFDKPKTWPRVVLEWLPYYIIALVIFILIQVRPDMSKISHAFIFLPAIVVTAVINAFGEEFIFRSVLLARLEPVLGQKSAILMAAALFGLMHFFGTPGGPFGVVLAGFLGWIAAKSMIETRSIIWAFLIHFIGDFMIYCSWAMMI